MPRTASSDLSHQYCNTDVVSRRSPDLVLLIDLNKGSPLSTLDLLESQQKVFGVFNQLVPQESSQYSTGTALTVPW